MTADGCAASQPCYHSITHYLKPITARRACFQHQQLITLCLFVREKKRQIALGGEFLYARSTPWGRCWMLSESWYIRHVFRCCRGFFRSPALQAILEGERAPASLIELFRVRWGRIDFLSHHLHRTSPGQTLIAYWICRLNIMHQGKQSALMLNAKATPTPNSTKLVLPKNSSCLEFYS